MKHCLYCFFAFTLFITADVSAQIEREEKSRQQLREMSGTFLPPEAVWFNAKRPFQVARLDRERVILHFWDPITANGWESMRVVNELHKKYPSAIALSVLPPIAELYNDSALVSELVRKFGINHPMIFTDDYSAFNFPDSTAINNLPSIYVVEATGLASGPVGIDRIAELETLLATLYPNEGKEASGIYKYSLPETGKGILHLLNYPSDAAEDPLSGNLFIADAGSNRIIELNTDGRIERVYGSGVAGLQDGKYGGTKFNNPKGLTFDRDNGILYVADTYNHCIRSIDPKTGVVKTVLGNGTLARELQLFVDSTENGLNYPADVAFTRGRLMIAMAGANQIWEYNPQNGKGRAAIGNGKAASVDGGTGVAALHSPQHLTQGSEGDLYVADIGSGKIRRIEQSGLITTLDFDDGLLGQHGVIGGLTFGGRELFISNYIGNQILKWNLDEEMQVLAGSGTPGKLDGGAGKAQFHRPAGLAYVDGDLMVIDQFNGALRRVNAKRGKTKSIGMYNFYDLFRTIEAYSSGDQVIFEELILKKGTNAVYVEMNLDQGYKWETAGRNKITMEIPGENRLLNFDPTRGFIELEVNGSERNNNATVQVYATVRHKETDQVTFRTFLLLFPLVYEPELGKRQHDLTWRPFSDL